jgi:hypothetical protein
VFVCRFLFYYWERKHDGGKKIGRRIALLACSSVRFAAQREKWEGPHNRAHHQPARFVPDFLVELICVCLFVCRTLENTHSLVRFSPFGKKRLFLFSFLFPKRFSQTCRVFFGCAVSPCPFTSASARLFSYQTKKIRNFIFLREEKLLDARRHQSKGLVPWFTAPEVSIYLNVPFWFEFF